MLLHLPIGKNSKGGKKKHYNKKIYEPVDFKGKYNSDLYLGTLCKYNHRFDGRDRSLRYAKSDNCQVCTLVTSKSNRLKREGKAIIAEKQQSLKKTEDELREIVLQEIKLLQTDIAKRIFGSIDMVNRLVKIKIMEQDLGILDT